MNEREFERAFSAIDPARDLTDDALEEVFPRATLTQRIYEGVTNHRSDLPRSPSRLLRRSVVVPVILALLAGGTAAAVTLIRSPQPVRLSALMGCYSQPSLTPKLLVVTNLTSTPGRTCAQQLAEAVKNGSSAPTWKTSDFTTPVLCVGKPGDLKVFPKSRVRNLCNTLNLAPFSGKVVVDDVSRFTQAVTQLSRTHRCLAFDVAVVDVKALLRLNGLGATWKVVLNNRSSSSKSCASFGFDDLKKIVYVVSI